MATSYHRGRFYTQKRETIYTQKREKRTPCSTFPVAQPLHDFIPLELPTI